MTSPETVKVVLQQIDDLVGNDQVLVVSKDNPESVKLVARLIAQDNKTAVLLGRSGVGKSSLVNMLVGCDIQATTPVRERDGRGRHTTVSREIISLPSGGSIIDMPGIRGLALWDADEGIEATFSDIEELAQACRFRDCTHTTEPGCAVQQAVKNGSLTPKRLESYIRLREESKKMKVQREEATRIRTRLGHPRSRR